MYRIVRVIHRWLGLLSSIFLLVIGVTGFLLATKGTFGWVRPPEKKGGEVELGSVASIHTVAEAAFAEKIPELQSREDINRIDYRPGKNMFKVVSDKGYHEVQVDGKTGQVLQVAKRTDQFAEDIHDLSWFHEGLHAYLLPLVSICLVYLSASGIGMFLTPVIRRRRHRAEGARSNARV
ncbi:MAG: PepSY domain-containing protein [Fimbriimonadaceae bacterium]|nr:PepSY domain-containing protein [Fimbriimonadaceae bacterium]